MAVVVALVFAASVASVDVAFASSAGLSPDGTTLVISGDAGDGFNTIDLSRESDGAGGERFVIDETGDDNSSGNSLLISAGNDCNFDPDAVDETVWCPASGVSSGTVDLKAGNDTFAPYGDIGITLTVHGDGGVDDITGGERADALFGDGNPALDEYGDPALEGDVLDGGEGADSLDGGAGSWDDASGGAGDDVLTDAGGDEDLLKGETGNDSLNGGSGDDDVLLGGTGADTLRGGTGVGDQAGYSERATGVTVTLDNSPNDGNSDDFDAGLNRSDDIGSDVEIVTGSYYTDTLTGSANGDELRGSPPGFAPWPVTQLTSDAEVDSDVAWSPDGTANENRIAFAGGYMDTTEIYTIDADDGSNRVRLTNNSTSDVGPAWSPDGTRIAFESKRSGSSDIWVMNADGSGTPANLTGDAATDREPAWSPDGTKIAFNSNRDGASDLYVMDDNGPLGGIVRLTADSADDRTPSWSPDSTQLVFAKSGPNFTSNLYTIDAGGSGSASLLFSDAYPYNSQPSWAPNGGEIAYVDRSYPGHWRIKSTFDQDPGYEVTNMGVPFSGSRPAWSPDSRRIVAGVLKDAETNIYTALAHYNPTGVEDTDVIDGGGGSDTLVGSWGDDEITGGPGIDTVSGGAGNDDIRIDDDEADGQIACDLTQLSGDADVVTADIASLDSQIASDCETVNRGDVPPPPTFTATSPTSPSNSDTTPEIIGSAAGTTVDLYTASGCSGASRVVDDAPASAFNTSGVTVTVSANSTTMFYATTTNGSATSPCSSTLGATGSIDYTHDSIAPAPPTPTSTNPASPSSDTNPAVIGTAEAGSQVRVYKGPDCAGAATGPVSAATYASPGVSVSVPANATTTFRATATDAAGNSSGCSAGLDYVNSSGSPPPAPTLTSTSPTSPSNSDTTPEIIGSAAGTTVDLYTASGCSGASRVVDDAPASAFNTSGVTAAVSANSTTSFYATTTNGSGTSPCSSTLGATGSIDYVHDSIAPAPPTPASTNPTSPSNTNTNPAVIGTAEVGSTVRVYKDACAAGPVTDTAANYAAGDLHVSVPANATTTFRATATDAAGNSSGCSAGLDYTHDSIAPQPPVITATDPPSPANDNSPRVIGSAEAGSDVRIYAEPGCTDASPPGADAAIFASPGITASVADNTTTEFRATATDEAGNSSSCSAPFAYDEVTPSGEIKVFGSTLSLTDNADTSKRRLSIRSKDLLIGIGAGNGSGDDPTLHGAKLRVRSDAAIPPFDREYDLPASNWRLIGTAGSNRGYKYKDALLVHGPIYSAQMRPGKPGKTGQLQFKGKGGQLDHTLATDPNAVQIAATVGAQRFCMEFGGTTAFKVNSYKAKNATAPTGACPGP